MGGGAFWNGLCWGVLLGTARLKEGAGLFLTGVAEVGGGVSWNWRCAGAGLQCVGGSFWDALLREGVSWSRFVPPEGAGLKAGRHGSLNKGAGLQVEGTGGSCWVDDVTWGGGTRGEGGVSCF